MPTRYLPDTNILSAYLKQERSVGFRLREVDFYLSSVVLGELYRWAFLSRKAERLAAVRAIAGVAPMIGIDEITSERYGRLTADLLIGGKLVSGNDMWIAAQALRHDLTVATRDSDFDRIPNLEIEQW